MAITAKGFTGSVDQVDFANLLSAVADNGVVGEYNDSNLSAARVAGTRTMLVQPGYVYAPGVWAHIDAAQNATTASALPGSDPRIDVLVAKFNWSAGTVTLVMKQGTAAGSPIPPTLQQDPGDIFEVPLRQGTITAGNPNDYLSSSIVDRRYWINEGKFVLPSTTTLPDAKIGAIAYRPDTKQLMLKGMSGWDTFNSQADSALGQMESPQDLLSLFNTNPTWAAASPANPTSIVGFSFVAPVTGKVDVRVKFHMQQLSGGGNCYGSFELRSGATVGQGSPVVGAHPDNGVGTSGKISADATSTVSGLVPGNTYNVRTMHMTDAAGASGYSVFYRQLTVLAA